MRKHSEIIKSANELYAELTKSFAEYSEAKKTQIESLSTISYDDAHAIVEGFVESTKALIGGIYSEDGTSLPKFLTSFTSYSENDNLASIILTIKSKLKDAVKYKKEVEIKVDEDFMKNFVNAYTSAIFDMYYRSQANANLEEVNNFFEKICVENNIPYTFGFALVDSNEYVTYIDNNKVIFNASLEAALEVSKNGLFQSGDEYFDLVREQQTEQLVDALLVTQTTTQLIKANIDIINTLIGYTTKKRADRLIRGAYHKKAEHFDKIKAGFGYYEKEDGDTTIFSILEKKADGSIEVALSPFDIKTLLNVDLDVVSEVKAMLA